MRKGLRPAAVGILALLAFGTSAASAQADGLKLVSVFPVPGTPVASAATTFSFRGLNPTKLSAITIFGSESGQHQVKDRIIHSDGLGVSVVPDRNFYPGERVNVYTSMPIKQANNGDFQVTIGRFYGNDDRNPGPQVSTPKDGLYSRPDLKPPKLTVLTGTDRTAPGKIFFAPKADGLTIADSFGRISWFRPTSFGAQGEQVVNFQAQKLYGKPVLTYWKGASSASGFSQIGSFEILNNRYNRIARFTPGNGYKADIHEFELTPRDTALVLAYRGVKWNATDLGGSADLKVLDNVVQEIDIETGAVLFEWHSLGNVGLTASAGALPTDGAPYDYFHANAVKDDGDSLLVSGRRTSTLYRIALDDAKVRWRLRGDGLMPETNDFQMGEGTSFGYQHDVERLPNGDISLFDNGSGRGVVTVNEESSALILRPRSSETDRSVSLVARHEHTPDPIVAGSQGNADPQGNGNFMVGWGSVSQITEFTPDGEIAFDATFKDSAISSYRAFRAPWRGFPKDRPAIATEAAGAGARVWASWNGATRVARWKVLSGTKASDLVEVGNSSWKNLETEIDVPEAGPKLKVVAYDSEGRQIGQSGLVEVGNRSR